MWPPGAEEEGFVEFERFRRQSSFEKGQWTACGSDELCKSLFGIAGCDGDSVEFQSWNDMSDREFGKYPS